MSKSYSNELYLLIKSMSMSEKRHFKLFASKHVIGEKNKYVRLFDAIDKLKEYKTEKDISIDGVNKQQVSLLKIRLQDAVIKSLGIYHASSTIKIRIRNYLNQAEIMMIKSLFGQCKKILQKAKTLALKYQDSDSLVQIIPLEWSVCLEMNDYNKLSSVLEKDLLFLKKILETKKRSLEYIKLAREVITLIKRTAEIRTDVKMKKIESIIKKTLFIKDQNELSYEARQNLYFSYAVYYRAKGDSENSLQYALKKIELMESFPEKIIENPESYTGHLFNLLTHMRRDKEAFFTTLKKLKDVPKKYPSKILRINWQVLIYSFHHEMAFYLDRGDFKMVIFLVKGIESGLKKYKNKISEFLFMMFYINISYAYFGAGDYVKAQQWINKVLKSRLSNDAESQDAFSFSKLFNLIIYLELFRDDLLEHSLPSTYNYLSRKDKLYKLEIVIINFIKDASGFSSEAQHTEGYKKLKDDLIKLKNDPLERSAFDKFDFIAWAESKIQQRPFAEIIKEKFKLRVEQAEKLKKKPVDSSH